MINRNQLFIFVVLSFIIIFSLGSTASSSPKNFSDVKKTHSHYEGIQWLVTKGINGYPDGKFGVDKPLSRQHAAIFFSKSLHLELPSNSNVELYFDDVKANHVYADYIAAVGQAGIFKGRNGKFGANDRLTRQQMATTLVNAFELKSTGKTVKMNVKNVDPTHRENVQILADLCITNQTKDFKPSNTVTRGQFATFLKRANDVVTNKIDTEMCSNQIEEKRINAINKKWAQLKPTYDGPMINSEPSVTAPYRLGSLNKKALQDALNLTNFVRYIAFLPSNITLNDSFNKEAQAASVINAANQLMTHYPERPQKMDNSLYKSGYDGAGASNIGYGYHTLTTSIKDGYMPDADNTNRDKVGHRRWILSPKLKEVGFGYAVATNGIPHTAMKVIAPNMHKNQQATYEHIAWPAETAFPVEFFGMKDPWSISLNPSSYDATKTKDISVTLTRDNDGKVWKFTSRGESKDGFFTIDTDNYGYTPFSIIFQPKQAASYQEGDSYTVEVNGLYTKSGSKTKFEFETTFFELD